MIDCHIHISLDGIDFKKSRDMGKREEIFTFVRRTLKEYKKRGIYVLRDGGDNLEISSIARNIAKDEGIILKSPVQAVYKNGMYGNFLGKGIENIEDFKEIFNKLKIKKLDHLKIILSGLVNFKKYKDVGEIGFTQEELKYIVDTAKYNNIPTMAHVNSPYGINMAVECGIDTIEHGYFITERELYKIGEKDIIWIPTLSPLGNLVINKDKRFENHIDIIKRVYEEHLKSVNLAYEMGVKMAVGSDSGCYGVLHVDGTFDEINHLVKAGIKKEEVIKMSIENGMRACNLNKKEKEYLLNQINVDIV